MKLFNYTDKSGRGIKRNKITLEEILKFENEPNWDGIKLHRWAKAAEVEDTWENAATKFTCTVPAGKIKEQYVKLKINNRNVWLQVVTNSKGTMPLWGNGGKLSGKNLKTGKIISFSLTDVIAFYTGPLKDISGLGMTYIPTAEACNVLDTIVPDSMGYETHIACRVVQEIIGKPLDEFVAEKLHYSGVDLCKALSAEQVDAVALCIYNIEYKNQGMIIGDQTGIGKGRVAAAMIRYGYYNKLKPIFLSEKPNLFTDIYRDLVDIGSKNLIPFIINGKEAKTDIKDSEGNIIHQALPKPEQDKIFQDKKFPAGYDFACATYTQFNSS